MESWLLFMSIALGMLMLLDPLIYAYIAYNLDVDSLYLGICSALWSICYILSSMIFGLLGDLGKSRLLAILSGIAIVISCALFVKLDKITALLAYSLHAISISALNLAMNSLIFDVVDSDQWGKTVLMSRLLGHTVRGTLLILVSLVNLLNIVLIQQLTAIVIFISIALIPLQIIPERYIYRMGRALKCISSYLKASTSLLYADKPETLQTMFERLWDYYPRKSLWKIGVATLLTTCIGDYVFTVLPLLMKNVVDLKALYLAYGITSMASVVVVLIGRISSESRGLILIATVLRSLTLILGIFALRDVLTLTIYVLTSSILYLVIDAMLYNVFISATGGYRSSVYYSLREIGSVFGALFGGLALSAGFNAFLSVAIMLSIMCIAINLS